MIWFKTTHSATRWSANAWSTVSIGKITILLTTLTFQWLLELYLCFWTSTTAQSLTKEFCKTTVLMVSLLYRWLTRITKLLMISKTFYWTAYNKFLKKDLCRKILLSSLTWSIGLRLSQVVLRHMSNQMSWRRESSMSSAVFSTLSLCSLLKAVLTIRLSLKQSSRKSSQSRSTTKVGFRNFLLILEYVSTKIQNVRIR